MKKVLCMLLAILCFSSFAYAEFDFSAMTDSELLELISNAQDELQKRSDTNDKEIVLYDENDIKVYLTRNYRIRAVNVTKGEYVIDLECVIINNSSHDIILYVPESSMNDWESGGAPCYGDSGGFDFSVNKNKKAKGVICFSLKEANVKEYEDIEKIDFTLGLYFDNKNYYSKSPDIGKDICLEFIDGVIFFKK